MPPRIRLNNGPVRGYEDDVGNKTTMRFFYPESASYNPELHNEPGTLMVLVPFKQNDLRWLKEILYNEKRVRMTSPPSCLLSLLVFSSSLSLFYGVRSPSIDMKGCVCSIPIMTCVVSLCIQGQTWFLETTSSILVGGCQ